MIEEVFKNILLRLLIGAITMINTIEDKASTEVHWASCKAIALV